LHEVLKSRERPVGVATLQDILGCSRTTVHRLVKKLRDELGAPLQLIADEGYVYGPGRETWELPGLWLSADDLASLRIVDAFLEQMEQGVLRTQVRLLRAQVAVLLEQAMADESISPDLLRSRLDVVPPKFTVDRPEIFAAVFEATMRKRRMQFADYARRRGDPHLREVSPLKLLHYRENWFLLGFCHDTGASGLFSLARLHHVSVLHAAAELPRGQDAGEGPAQNGAQTGLAASGRRQQARLKFNPAAAATVAGKIWHPEQVGQFATDGSFELRVPYVRIQEVLPAVLEHGASVVVEGPKSLRTRVKKELAAALRRYEDVEV
jgi:predicted DNA-binding transcriptional regulator YafY